LTTNDLLKRDIHDQSSPARPPVRPGRRVSVRLVVVAVGTYRIDGVEAFFGDLVRHFLTMPHLSIFPLCLGLLGRGGPADS
jgi:hypothetical protein